MKNTPAKLAEAVARVPAGAWAVGVSGGADSVALLSLLRAARGDALSLHIVHLDHETRGAESDADAEFVGRLARQWNLPVTVARRSQVEPSLPDLPANPSARYRAVRLALFRQVVAEHRLGGVILAHHADDQAETVLHRLLRTESYTGLVGMSRRTQVSDLLILRPLLDVTRPELTDYLKAGGLTWRTDASNTSPQYLRNRLRVLLEPHPRLSEALRELGGACAALRDWSRDSAPVLEERFRAAQLARLPTILATESGRRWLIDRGVPIDEVSSEVSDRLVTMSRDAATPAQQQFPGRVRVRRRGGFIFIDR